MKKLYGTDPLFIFDPSDDSNAPDPRYHKNALDLWPIYPQCLRDKFTQSFVEGLRDVNRRVRENEWRSTLVELRDSIYKCPACREEVFFDAGAVENGGGNRRRCWSCDRELGVPFRIEIHDGSRNTSAAVVLTSDTRLYPHHVDGNLRYDFSEPVAEVVSHPKDPRKRGLKNLTDRKWVMTNSQGVMKDVEPGRSVTIAAGNRVNFGGLEGEFVR